jgi:hypothetical protein
LKEKAVNLESRTVQSFSDRGGIKVLNYRFALGLSNLLHKKGIICSGALALVSDSVFTLADLKIQQHERILGPADMHSYAQTVAGEYSEVYYFGDVHGFLVGVVEAGESRMLQSVSLKDLAQAIAYAYAGAMSECVRLLLCVDLNQSVTSFIREVLSQETCFNILAECLYGNAFQPPVAKMKGKTEHDHAPYNVVTPFDKEFHPVFWGLPFRDPKETYAGTSFYIHPAGLRYNKRWCSLPYTTIGQEVILESEPHNRYDANAVHLWTSSGVDLGYLPQAIASMVSFHMRNNASYSARIAFIQPEAPIQYGSYGSVSLQLTRSN